MIYFTADTHFGHYNVIRFCDRPFASAEEMDEAMIQNWNDRVTGNDTVYILGDMFFRSTNAEGILKRLKGKKRLIVGNHDGSWMTKFDYARYFFSVDRFLETSDGKHSILYKYEQVNHSNAKPLFRSRKGGFFAFQGARKIFSTFFEKHPQKSLPYSE